MPRKVSLPEGFQPNNAGLWEKNGQTRSIERNYRLVTPLFGGGEQANRADSVTVLRSSSIKGQLRFWWRAVRGWRSEGNLQRLLALEEQIWGGVTVKKQSSRVGIRLDLLEPADATKLQHLNAQRAPRYVAFPLLQGSEEDKKKGLAINIRFRLTLTLRPESGGTSNGDALGLKELKDEVQAALWAWETFGGIGARTRRGFGAVEVKGFTKNPPRKGLETYGNPDSRNWPKDVPHLTTQSKIQVFDIGWRDVIDLYQRFRQFRPDINRVWHNGKEREVPGPNKWPEAALIRWAYDPRKYQAPDFLVAPRTLFGLPIPFFFLQDKSLGKEGKMRLTGKQTKEDNIDRLASPLIIRPQDEKTTLVAILEGPRIPPGGVFLHPTPRVKALANSPIEVKIDDAVSELIEAGLDVLKIGGTLYADPVLAFWECLRNEECIKRLRSVHV